MRLSLTLFMTGLSALSFCFPATAQIRTTVMADTWNSMWLGMTGFGTLGEGQDTCRSNWRVFGGDMPGGSGMTYLSEAALWIGAIIDNDGQRTPRVSVATDGWQSPSINEIWPTGDPVIERSTRDTTNCSGDNLYDPAAQADHEIEMVMTDTLTDREYVINDPVDGLHHPLGLKITRTTYSSQMPSCDRVYWIRYDLENIGTQRLLNLFLGHLVRPCVGDSWWDSGYCQDDLAGYIPSHELAYLVDNDGLPSVYDPERSDQSAPHVAALTYLLEANSPVYLSFNWWINLPNWDQWSYGPSLEGSPDWEEFSGEPEGDLRRYLLMSNGQRDFDQVYLANDQWIDSHPQDGQAWRPCWLPDSNRIDAANGYPARYLFSLGPLGHPWYEDAYGHWVYKLDPGESIEVWAAIIGGRWFHDPDHPQTDTTAIDPSLFNLTDLLYRADIVQSNLCVEWTGVDGQNRALPAAFTLEPVYPNPFNSSARVRFNIPSAAHVTLTAYDLLGREAARLGDGLYTAGEHELIWDASGLTSGIYFVEARTAHGMRLVQKAVLLK